MASSSMRHDNLARQAQDKHKEYWVTEEEEA
jgi:hypothetical protein